MPIFKIDLSLKNPILASRLWEKSKILAPKKERKGVTGALTGLGSLHFYTKEKLQQATLLGGCLAYSLFCWCLQISTTHYWMRDLN